MPLSRLKKKRTITLLGKSVKTSDEVISHPGSRKSRIIILLVANVAKKSWVVAGLDRFYVDINFMIMNFISPMSGEGVHFPTVKEWRTGKAIT